MSTAPASYVTNHTGLGAAILAYAEVAKGDLPEILRDQANKLSCSDFSPTTRGLFQESATTAPSIELLEGLPAAKNWRIRRRDRNNPALVRPIFTQGYELLTYKRNSAKGRKGEYRRNKKGQIQHRIVGLEGVIPRRERARLYQAAGWLSAALNRYAGGAAAGAGQQPNRAQVELTFTDNVFTVTITNTSEAALEVAMRTGYLQRALDNRERDLNEYVARKWAELANKINSLTLPTPR